MRVSLCRAALVVACLSFSMPLHAQTGLTADFAKDIGEVQDKIVGLAKALPAGAYDWRPAKEVRSTGEVLMHVAADNYFLPAAMGIPAPAETGIVGKEYKTAAAFEKKKVTRDEIIAEVEKSFAFLKKSIGSVSDDKLGGTARNLRSEDHRPRDVAIDGHPLARAPRAAHRLRAQQQRHAAVE